MLKQGNDDETRSPNLAIEGKFTHGSIVIRLDGSKGKTLAQVLATRKMVHQDTELSITKQQEDNVTSHIS